MATFIGSNEVDNNLGEDCFLKKLIEYLDNRIIVYRNRPVYGRELDVVILVPDMGLIVFECKGWRPETVSCIENGDQIVISTPEGEVVSNPQKQGRGYCFNLERKIRDVTRAQPLIFSMSVFPQIDHATFLQKHMDTVCEERFSITADDLINAQALKDKLNQAFKEVRHRKVAPLTPELFEQIRSMFEGSSLKTSEPWPDRSLTPIPQISQAYSLFCYLPHEQACDEVIDNIKAHYAKGCRIYVVTQSPYALERIAQTVDEVLSQKGLRRNGTRLAQNSFGDTPLQVSTASNTFLCFHCSVFLAPQAANSLPHLYLLNGDMNEQERKALHTLSKVSDFNVEQFEVQHADPQKHIIVRAGAGTGKTSTMIDRVSFISYMLGLPLSNLIHCIVMITFTSDAAEHMKAKLKNYYEDYFLLTRDPSCLELLSLIDQMQISTIHSYAKKIIGLLGAELGYGAAVQITSSEYLRKLIVQKELDAYLRDMQRRRGDSYIGELGLAIYEIQDRLLDFISRLHNKSIDMSRLTAANFGQAVGGTQAQQLHDLFATLIPKIEATYDENLCKDNRIHLSALMATLNRCLEQDNATERLRLTRPQGPQFLFVDEFQDTDDVQIQALLTIAKYMGSRMFVVGDIKQCIYRFRGAEEQAFNQLGLGGKEGEWLPPFVLRRNYRTDRSLLNRFHQSFSGWNAPNEVSLLSYSPTEDRLIGVKCYHNSVSEEQYYRELTVSDDSQRMDRLFEEINYQVARILNSEATVSEERKNVAILVRENWQADLIKRISRLPDRQIVGRDGQPISIIADTGGDLYQSAPALDMLTLANALLHYDEPSYLYSLVSSNFLSLTFQKAYLYQLRRESWHDSKGKAQSEALIDALNVALKGRKWEQVVSDLRTRPTLPVIRELYKDLKPWANYEHSDLWRQKHYRLNVSLLFEQLLGAFHSDRLTVNNMIEFLSANIMSRKQVEARIPFKQQNDVTVRCLTVHKAKGLEYGSVILPFCSFSIDAVKKADLQISTEMHGDDLQIGYRMMSRERDDDWRDLYHNNHFNLQKESREHAREEARVLYVAMTRAIDSFSWISLKKPGRAYQSWQQLAGRKVSHVD